MRERLFPFMLLARKRSVVFDFSRKKFRLPSVLP